MSQDTPEPIDEPTLETPAPAGEAEVAPEATPEPAATGDEAPPPASAEAASPDGETAEGPAAEGEAPVDDEDASAEDAEAPAEGKRKSKAPKKERPAWKPPPPERLQGAVEAVLMVAGDVVRLERLRDLLGLASLLPLREAITAIGERWAAAGLAFEIEQVGGGVRVVTRPEYGEYVARLSRRPVTDKLSRALLETLCIVAYKQPVGRAEVERVRGVQAGEALRQLLDRRMLKVVGRSEQPGRPLLYGTTQQFLTSFGLDDLKDLPQPQDLKRL